MFDVWLRGPAAPPPEEEGTFKPALLLAPAVFSLRSSCRVAPDRTVVVMFFGFIAGYPESVTSSMISLGFPAFPE